MRGKFLFIILVTLVVSGYFYWYHPFPSQNKVTTAIYESEAANNQSPIQSSPPTDSENQPEALQTADPLREEAQEYVSEITEHEDNPVAVDEADDFVTRNEPITLFANRAYETQTIEQLKKSIKPDAPLTIVREQEQVEMITAKELVADSGGDLSKSVKVMTGGDVKKTTVGEVIENHPSPDSPISIIRKTENLEVTTLKELMENETVAADEPIKVIREPYRLQTTTVDELLMGEKTVADHSIFYVRNVTPADSQGLWGIVHNGLVKNFASGIAIRRDQEIQNYQVDIPTNADERLDDRSSSFLGKMIDQKTRESYVYNYQRGIMGRNPDVIHSGQEVVIIGFTPEELYKIYEHFVTRSESRS